MDYIPPGSSVHGFLRQEYWNGLPFPSPGDLPNPGIESASPAWQADSLPLSYLGSPKSLVKTANYFMYHSVQRAIRILTKAINTLTRVKSGTTSITVNQCWSWKSNTLAIGCEELTHLKRPWCWERLQAGGEGDNGGWDGWMASPTQWTWVWVNFRSWWWTGSPGMLPSMGLQRVGYN